MAVDKKKYRAGAILATVFFISVIAIGIAYFSKGLRTEQLPLSSIIKISSDLFSMALGYILFVCSIVDLSDNEENLNYYLLMIFTCFVSTFTDEICWLVDGKPELTFLNGMANTIYYMGAPVLAFLFWRYVVSYLEIAKERIRKYNIGFAAGLATAVLLRVLNVAFGFYFYIDPDGVYHRGSLYIFSNLYTYSTIILTIILVVIARKKFKRYQVVILFLYAFFPLVVGLVSVFSYGLSLTSPVIMLVLLMMYCVLNVVQNREKSISDRELQMANTIQEGMLPHVFPPYPDNPEFDLHATMIPAKEVGGDFYDFYMPDDDHLVVTIADVSGKGIPAALMMMVTKTLIKNRGFTDYMDCSKILYAVNEQLSENSDLDMFVTAWVAVLTLSTGELRYANAGHEYPAIKRKGGRFELLKDRHAPPLGCMEGIPYSEQKTKLDPGDTLFVYTDGVTEATNTHNVLFGEKRMLEALNKDFNSMQGLLDNVKAGIDEFIGSAEQFDDLTMLSVRYNGKEG